jgi:L-ascorbate metabolism protein UlaG (beta-lactamase superfamily)
MVKITKYEHACLVVEEAGETLVIDPGVLAKLPELTNVVAVVVTHIHPDHLHMPNLLAIAAGGGQFVKLGVGDELVDA